jgi:hypothetical protein
VVIVIKAAFQFTVLFAWLAQSATPPLRTGDVARQLSQEDIAAIERTLPSGEKPWLLNGDRGDAAGLEYIEAYLPPTNATPLLRRGTVITVMRRIPPHFPEATEWTVQETHSYAQVAIPGTGFDQIEGDQDTNRPFWVIGRFDDGELVRLVQFLRSDPPIRGGERVQPWPILIVGRQQDDSVQVLSRGGVGHGQVIKLRQVGQDWMVVGVGGAS